MKKKNVSAEKKNSSWTYKLKTLPNTRSGTAAGICKVLCTLPLVLVALVLWVFNIDFPFYVLIFVYFALMAVDHFLFAKWVELAKKFA
jgi:uncharacterized membrane protein